MIETMAENTDFSLPVGIVHGSCIEEAETLASIVKEKTKFTNVIINDISPSIGAHAGPGALGLLYYGGVKAPAKETK